MKIPVNLLCSLLFVVALLPGSDCSAEQLYVVEGKRGAVTFTTRKPKKGNKYRVFKMQAASFSKSGYSLSKKGKAPLIESDYDDLLKQAAKRYGVDYSLVRAVVHAESAFKPKAISPKGAQGLMQLMPTTAKRFGVKDSFIPAQNIDGGVQYLARLHKDFAGNKKLLIAAYNAGENAVKKYGGIPPFKETVHYVKKVVSLERRYGCLQRIGQDC